MRSLLTGLVCGLCLISGVVHTAPLLDVRLTVEPPIILADGQSRATVRAQVFTESGRVAEDGVVVRFHTTLGTLSTNTATTSGGIAEVELTSALTIGSATVTAVANNASAGRVLVRFTNNPKELTGTLEYISFEASYLAYSADYRILESLDSAGAECRIGPIRIEGIAYQYHVDRDELTAAAAYVSVGETKHYLQDIRIRARDMSGVASAPGMPGQMAEISAAGISFTEGTAAVVKLQDLSDSQVVYVMKRAVVVPGRTLQAYRTTLYVAGSKAITLPLYEVNLASREPLGQTFMGFDSRGVTVDLPVYYAMRPGSVGSLHLRRGQVFSTGSLNADPVWTVDLEHQFGLSGSYNADLRFTRMNRPDWGASLGLNKRFGRSHSAYAYFGLPANTMATLNSGAVFNNASGRVGVNVSGSEILQGNWRRDLRMSTYYETRPQRLIGPFRYLISPSYATRRTTTSAASITTQEAGIALRMMAIPWQLGDLTLTPAALSAYTWGTFAEGASWNASLLGYLNMGKGWGLDTGYEFTDGFRYTGDRHRLNGGVSWVGSSGSQLGVRTSMGLETHTSDVWADASLWLGSYVVVGGNYYISKGSGLSSNELVINAGVRAGPRVFGLAWSNLTKSWRFQVQNAPF